ncbi:hypothetical protein F383_34853 [Gossypium arboreum]|uniref:Uncharacterized protein n=1 Tax=Gossypium arboreum TaxID=29729 RepID=A0A0B0PNS7_GOSAR|nr:hypothetical protein F383_34853 [Gossypium arboreum]
MEIRSVTFSLLPTTSGR